MVRLQQRGAWALRLGGRRHGRRVGAGGATMTVDASVRAVD